GVDRIAEDVPAARAEDVRPLEGDRRAVARHEYDGADAARLEDARTELVSPDEEPLESRDVQDLAALRGSRGIGLHVTAFQVKAEERLADERDVLRELRQGLDEAVVPPE